MLLIKLMRKIDLVLVAPNNNPKVCKNHELWKIQI